MSLFTLSAFGDEIDADLQTQVNLLRELAVPFIEFRSAWGKNVKDLTDEELHRAQAICSAGGIGVSCIGSPIGKTPLLAPLAEEIAVLQRVFRACDLLQTRHIRIFSFYPPDPDHDAYLAQSIERLGELTALAAREGCTLLLENDEELIGDNISRVHAILSSINSPHLRYAWDGANFVRSGVLQPTTHAWDTLYPFLGTVHIKDARIDRSQRAAGEGDAEIIDLLRKLVTVGYIGFLAVEPHPYLVDGRGEIKGAEGMTYAVAALRKLLAQL